METNGQNTSVKKVSYSSFVKLLTELSKHLSQSELSHLRQIIKKTLRTEVYLRDPNVGNMAEVTLNTLFIMMGELKMRSAAIIALILQTPFTNNIVTKKEIKELFGQEVAEITMGLEKVQGLVGSTSAIASENYVKLLIILAEDMRVILIRIASTLFFMRNINNYDRQVQLQISMEVKHLYAPLAHKLGLYGVKTEMEDLYLKYTDPEAYNHVVRKLADSEEVRSKFIADFITPIEEKLNKTGLKYDMKGRIKSISSINNKILKQHINFESIYDIFAIRVILDSPIEMEKAECWQVYSIITDMYMPNPKRLKDWLSIPKSNGYESLHSTVMSPESRWVEVQIRSKRMDEIAERGLAAHWKYKGIKSQSKIDEWLANLREVLENNSLDTSEKMEDFKLDVYDDEIYAFTPKGDLHKLPQGATVLDFAFAIHSKVGAACVSGKVNDKNVSIRHQLNNGDQIEIVTSPNQRPKQDWLGFVHSSKARNKIRQSLKEDANKQVEIAKELLKRRFKNRKIDAKESILMRLVKKLGFKQLTDFYVDIAEEKLDVNNVLDQYLQLEKSEIETQESHNVVSADKYVAQMPVEKNKQISDELILDKDLTGIDYSLAPCCNPIYGDEIFGFVSTAAGIKIHRQNCPNAHDMFSRFEYRVIPARWSGTSQSSYTVTLRIVGDDNITVVNNITHLIAKEDGVGMRGINIDSNDGVFHGNITVMLQDRDKLNMLVIKLRNIRGVKNVSRSS